MRIKVLSITLFLLYSLILVSCGRKIIENESINGTTFSDYQLQCTAVVNAKNLTVGSNRCIEKIIEKILFIGFPNTISNTPLINNPNNQQNKDFYTNFIKQKQYQPFISSYSQDEKKMGNKSDYYVVVTTTIVIDVVSLRRELEKYGLSRKFGY
jgi:hypothetical protein